MGNEVGKTASAPAQRDSTPISAHTVTVYRDHWDKSGAQTIQAVYVCGPFAVHKSLEGSGYTVTHIPTGAGVRKWIHSRLDARRLSDVLARDAWKLWDFTEYTQFARRRSRLKQALLDALKECGL